MLVKAIHCAGWEAITASKNTTYPLQWVGFKAIKQNKNGPPFYNEGDECTRLVGVVYVFVLKPIYCVSWVTCF
jgi:hypothetical protein